MKCCTKCGMVKPLSEFYRSKSGRLGHHAWCKTCFKTDQRERFSRDPSPRRAQARETQDGRCAVCLDQLDENAQRAEAICVDHDHSTGKVRGLLCPPCNRGLGFLRDNPTILRAAARYIETRKTMQPTNEGVG